MWPLSPLTYPPPMTCTVTFVVANDRAAAPWTPSRTAAKSRTNPHRATFLAMARTAYARRPARDAAALADRDRAQRLPPALPPSVAPAGGGPARGRTRRDCRRERRADAGGDPAGARPPSVQPALGARPARARGALVCGDRGD